MYVVFGCECDEDHIVVWTVLYVNERCIIRKNRGTKQKKKEGEYGQTTHLHNTGKIINDLRSVSVS